MRGLLYKNLPALLVFIITCCLFSLMPIVAGADSASELNVFINGFNHGGTGTLVATPSGNTVTVGGGIAGARKPPRLSQGL